MQIGDVTTPKARKEHDCFWCGEIIFKHETYARWVWKNDVVETIKVHTECKDAWDSLPASENEIWFGEFSRGCTCEHGQCKCPDPMIKYTN